MTVVIFAFISIFSEFSLLNSSTFLTHKTGLTHRSCPDFLLSLRCYSYPDLELCLKFCWWFFGFCFWGGGFVCSDLVTLLCIVLVLIDKFIYFKSLNFFGVSSFQIIIICIKTRVGLNTEILKYWILKRVLNTMERAEENAEHFSWGKLRRILCAGCRLGFVLGGGRRENTRTTLCSNEQKKPAHLEYIHRSCFAVDLLNIYLY